MVESGNYLIAYYDADGKRQETNSGTPDRATAEQIAGQLETEVALRKRGIIDATQERFSSEGRRPLAEHLADFRDYLNGKGNTGKHVDLTCTRIEALVAKCKAEQLGSLAGTEVLRAIGDLRSEGAGLRTCNGYLQAVKSFTRWAWREKRAGDDPLVGLRGFNQDTDRRHVRRELTPEELAYLLPFVEGYTTPNHNLSP